MDLTPAGCSPDPSPLREEANLPFPFLFVDTVILQQLARGLS